MKTHKAQLLNYLVLLCALFGALRMDAQSTAFTYQGRLNDGGNPANGSYDLTFALFDASNGVNQVGGVLTNAATTVSNGLFTVTLDFGSGVFTGADRWLEIGVRMAGDGAFATLAPRQQVTATPYAVQAANAGTATTALIAGSANSVSSANITGPIQLNQLASPVLTNNQSGVSLNGDFTGNAAGLTNLLLANVARTTQTGVIAWGYNGGGQANVPPGLANVTSLAAGYFHSLALKNDGTVVVWGDGSYGQTNVPPGLNNVTAVAAGIFHSVALKNDGTVVVWGDNTYGQTNVPPGLGNVTAVAAGAYFSLAVKNDGTVVGWGDNNFGETNIPTDLTNVTAVAAGIYHGLALKSDGTVVAWGGNPFGQTNVPSDLTNVVAIAAGAAHSLTLKNDGTVIAWGDNDDGQTNVPPGLNNVAAIAAGAFHSLALKDDGTLAVWGDNSMGQTNVPSGGSNIIAIAQGSLAFHGLALQSQTVSPATLVDGKIPYSSLDNVPLLNAFQTFTGANTFSNAAGLFSGIFSGDGAGLTNINATNLTGTINDASLSPNVALLNANQTFTGANTFNNPANLFTGNGAGLINLQLGAVAPTTNFGIVAWGSDFAGQADVPAGLTNVLAAAGARQHSIALKRDGTVIGWGDNSYGQTSVPLGLNNVKAVSAAGYYTLALKNDGTVVAWGGSDYGQTSVPSGLSNVTAVAAGFYDGIVLKNDGTVVVWGNNSWGQTNVPGGLNNVTAVAAGGEHLLVLKNDGTVVAWGDNNSGQCSVPPGLTNVVGIAAGDEHSLALKSDGTVVGWGADYAGQADVPPGLTNVTAVAAGSLFSLALKNDGTVVAWGYGNDGETAVPPGLSNVVALASGTPTYHALVVQGGTTFAPATLVNGTLQDASLSANVALRNGTQAFTGSNTFNNASGNFNGAFTGNGAALTSLNASNLANGTVSDLRLSTNVALLSANQTFAGANTFTNSANTFTGDGSRLTSLNASNLTTGTVSDLRLSGNVALLNTNQTFSGSNIFSGVAILTNINNTLTGTHSGSGAGLTSLNATNLTGLVADQRLSPNVALLSSNQTFLASNIFSGVAVVTNANNTLIGMHFGNANGLTNLNVTNLFGTIADQRLSPNVALLNTNQIFSGSNTFSGSNFFGGVVTATNVNNNLRGTFTGNGGGLTNLNATNLTGLVADQRLSPNVSLLSSNQTFLASNIFSGVAVVTNANNTLVGTYFGNGSGLTNLNATNLFGTLADQRLSPNVALLSSNQTFLASNIFSGVAVVTNANNTLVGTHFGNGSGLTNLNVTNLFGTIADARLSTNVALLSTNQIFSGSNVFGGTSRFAGVVFATNIANQVVGAFTGNGAGLTNLNASQIVSGTIPLAQLPFTVVTNNGTNLTLSGTFNGNGTGLTNLNAANLASGTVADGVLSTNVALRAGGNTFYGNQQMLSTVPFGSVAVDQQQTVWTHTTQVADEWQSFTAGQSGLLTKLDLQLSSPIFPSDSTGILRIYAGEGTGGALLATQNVTFAAVQGQFQTYVLNTPVQVQTGALYTYRLTAPSFNTSWVYVNINNPYAAGRSSSDPGWDCLFKTYVQAVTNGIVLSVNGSGISGPLIGIGTNAPQAALHVVGDVLASGDIVAGGNLIGSGVATFTNANNVIAGNGAALTALNASNLTSGTVADARLTPNVALLNTNQIFSASNIFSGVVTATNGNNALVGTHSGNGAGLTNLNASQLASGTVPDARLAANVARTNANQTLYASNIFLGVVTATNVNNQFAGTFFCPYLKFAETNANVSPGATVAGTNNFRSFNAELADTQNIGSLSGGNIVLPTGTYQCRISAPGFRVETHQIRLRTTGGLTLLWGTIGYSDSSTGGSEDRSQIDGQFTIGATTTLQVQHYCRLANAAGLGTLQSFDWGDSDQYVFAVAEFWKVK